MSVFGKAESERESDLREEERGHTVVTYRLGRVDCDCDSHRSSFPPGSARHAMADNKRQSMASKIATPNLKPGAAAKDVAVADADSSLYKAVGSR